MSPEKKVLFLLLSLILLITACVYTNLPKFMEESKSEVSSETSLIEKNEEVIETIQKEPIVQDNLTLKEEDKTAEIDGKIKKEDTQEKVLEEKNIEYTAIEEEKEEPLIFTDKRYNRIGTEKNIEDLSKTTQELQVKMSDYVKNNPVTFTRASYKLTNKSNNTIQMVVEALKEFSNIKIEVAGHTDAVGAKNVNQLISQERANRVKARLVDLGIDENRIIARGYGEDIPLVKNSAKGYSKINRRVEFNIIEE